MDERIRYEYTKLKRNNKKFSIVLCDIDYFKKINDEHGHQVGDAVLVRLVTLMSEQVRSSDIVARYGGEEFIILAPETDISGASIHAERLRNDIEKYEFETVGHITSSFGIAEFKAETDDVDSILDSVTERTKMVFLANPNNPTGTTMSA